MSQDSSGSEVTGYGKVNQGSISSRGQESFSSSPHPDQLCRQPSYLSDG